jgi:hypothetical protein
MQPELMGGGLTTVAIVEAVIDEVQAGPPAPAAAAVINELRSGERGGDSSSIINRIIAEWAERDEPSTMTSATTNVLGQTAESTKQ